MNIDIEKIKARKGRRYISVEGVDFPICVDDYLEYKEIEKELGIDLIILHKAEKGFYYKDKDGEIKYSGNRFIRVRNYLIETTPCYEVKETTIFSCYNPEKYPSPSKEVKDAQYWSWETCLYFDIKDYGKTWALTREELL